MRLIDADALLEYLMINMGWHDEDGIAVDNSDEKRAIFKDLIDGVPTVDAVPVKHGRWEEETVGSIEENAVIADWQSARCSVCKRYLTTPYMYYFEHYNYCPNCGAEMGSERKDT